MAEYIKCDNIEAIKELLDCCCSETSELVCATKSCNKCKAEYLKKHGVTVKTFGHWKKVSDKSPRYCCSVCNHLFNNKEYKYCPWCGAKMKGKNKVKEIEPGEVCELNGNYYMRFTNSPEILYCDGANIPMINVKTGSPAMVSRDVLVRPVDATIVIRGNEVCE